MNSSFVKRSVTIEGHRVGIRIEDLFWISLEEIAKAQATSTSKLVAAIDAGRDGANLPSAIRVYVIDHFAERIQCLDDADDPPSYPVRPSAASQRPRWLN
jgi:predicted DNA-binding ribbon-helix-helix protein